jgi:ribonuclease R
MTVTNRPVRGTGIAVTRPALPTHSTGTASTTATTATTAVTAATHPGDGVDPTGRGRRDAPKAPTVPQSISPLALVTPAALDAVMATATTLAGASDPTVRQVFGEALAAATSLHRAVTVEMPLRLAVLTGKANPLQAGGQGAGLPREVPGIVRERAGEAVFYPADECIKPFPIARDQAALLPRDTILIARATKKQAEFRLPDGSVEKATIYQLGSGSGVREPRPRFVGVIDFVGGEPFARDLLPPPRLVPLPAAPPGGAWQEGSIVDVAVSGDAVTIEKTLARAGTPMARTWMVAAATQLDAVFPAAALAEAAAIEAAAKASLADPSLVDRRHEPFFAIDNPGSTDIDQAMRLQKRPDGGYVVSYALADPSHYIKPGMALFEEAMQRGASYYLPGLSIPMLPDTLSEGVVSLNAHEDHRAMIIEIRLDKDGVVEGPASIQRAVIHSKNQLTYGGVSAELQGQAPIEKDEHGKAVDPAVREQLKLFEEIGNKRIVLAKVRGVVEPERREMTIGFDDGRFFLRDEKSDYASRLNAEFSILANVAGAQQLLSSTVPGLYLPGIFRVHPEPGEGAYRALARQVRTIVDQHGLPDTWRWQPGESLSAWVDRIKTLPTTERERDLALVLQQAAVRINVSSEYQREPGRHSGLKVDHYGRFSAPMRELVGLMSHAVVFAKDALERAVAAANLGADDARALWAPLLLGVTVDPARIPASRRSLAREALALLSSSPATLPDLARTLAAQARSQGPLSAEEQRLVDGVFDRAMQAGNNGKMKQGTVDGAARKLLFDDLFLADLGGNPLGRPDAPKRRGVITAVTPGKVYVQLREPDVEIRLGIDDLRRHCPGARFQLTDEACALVADRAEAGPVARLTVGGEVFVQATHHDGDRLHFTIVHPDDEKS